MNYEQLELKQIKKILPLSPGRSEFKPLLSVKNGKSQPPTRDTANTNNTRNNPLKGLLDVDVRYRNKSPTIEEPIPRYKAQSPVLMALNEIEKKSAMNTIQEMTPSWTDVFPPYNNL